MLPQQPLTDRASLKRARAPFLHAGWRRWPAGRPAGRPAPRQSRRRAGVALFVFAAALEAEPAIVESIFSEIFSSFFSFRAGGGAGDLKDPPKTLFLSGRFHSPYIWMRAKRGLESRIGGGVDALQIKLPSSSWRAVSGTKSRTSAKVRPWLSSESSPRAFLPGETTLFLLLGEI